MVNKMYTTKAITEIMCQSLTEFYHSWMVSVASALARDDFASARTYTHKFNGQLNMIVDIEHRLYDADMDFGLELYDLHHFYFKLSKRMICHLLYL